MAALLPKELERRQEENDRAFQLAKDAKEQLLSLQHIEGDASGSKESLLKAQQTYDEHEQFRRRTASRLQTIKNNIQDSQLRRLAEVLGPFGVSIWSSLGPPWPSLPSSWHSLHATLVA